MLKKIAILSNGGDCPGINAVIRAIVKTAERNGIKPYGFIEGYRGLLDNDYVELSSTGNVSGVLDKGGTIIGSSNNTNVFNLPVEEKGKLVYKDMSDQCIKNIKKAGFDCLFTIGGDSTQKSARDLSTKGVNIIGIPKTIDNDVVNTDVTFGFNTAVEVATEAIDRLHSTAESHKRVMILEVMGRYAGWIALESGIAGGADNILIPEIPYDINKIINKIDERKKRGKPFSIIVIAEGAKPKDGDITIKRLVDTPVGLDNIRLGGVGDKLAEQIEEMTGIITRSTTLGYVQRGGVPSVCDRILSTKYGSYAMRLALEGKFNVLVAIRKGKLDHVTLESVIGRNKTLGAASGNTKETSIKRVKMDDDLVVTARSIGICLGD